MIEKKKIRMFTVQIYSRKQCTENVQKTAWSGLLPHKQEQHSWRFSAGHVLSQLEVQVSKWVSQHTEGRTYMKDGVGTRVCFNKRDNVEYCHIFQTSPIKIVKGIFLNVIIYLSTV